MIAQATQLTVVGVGFMHTKQLVIVTPQLMQAELSLLRWEPKAHCVQTLEAEHRLQRGIAPEQRLHVRGMMVVR